MNVIKATNGLNLHTTETNGPFSDGLQHDFHIKKAQYNHESYGFLQNPLHTGNLGFGR